MSGTNGNIDISALPLATQSQFPTLRLVAVTLDENGVPIASYGVNFNDIDVTFPLASSLPTTLPSTAGVYWNNGGVLSIS